MATKLTKEEMTAKLIEFGVDEAELEGLNAKDLKALYDEKKPVDENEIPEDCVKVQVVNGTIFGKKVGEELIMLKEVADSYGEEYVKIIE